MDSVIKPDLWLDRLRSSLVAVDEARDSGDREAVHTLRVATRRIDAWLQLAGIRVFRDDLRRLRHAAGKVRDIDVARTREKLPPQVATWLDDEYPAAREELVRA
ncbi:MAG: CHAD domain-containing protein, partial [Planctomycetes bacterium]|nr:CHAD domain-containing protein [Planctomycetota bacterium]